MIDNDTLETVALRLEGMAGNNLYQAAWRKAAKIVRGMKILKGQPQLLNDSAPQISSVSSHAGEPSPAGRLVPTKL